MADLTLMRRCGNKPNPGGAKADLYITCTCELSAWPKTRAEVLIAASETPVAGDTKILDEPFDFSGAAGGSGNWSKIPIRVNSAALNDLLEGESGGQGYKSELPFEIVGTDAEELEFADKLLALSGCLIAMIADNNDNYRVLGELDQPCEVSGEGMKTGLNVSEKRGGTFKLTAMTGKTAPIYDAATHGIDLTPNP